MNKSPRDQEKSAFTLIELLVVIAIIGILMSLLFPAVGAAIDAAKKAQAKNDVTQLATAITAYYTEYGKLPPDQDTVGYSPSSDKTFDAASNGIVGILMGTLTNNNPRQIVFLEVSDVSTKKGKSGLKGGNFIDPWGNIYQIILDYDYNNSLDITPGADTSAGGTGAKETVRKTVGVFNISSSSTKSTDSNSYRHVVKSWN